MNLSNPRSTDKRLAVRSVAIAVLLGTIPACSDHIGDQPRFDRRAEVLKTEQECEPWPEFRCIWEDHAVTLRGEVAAGEIQAARLVELFDLDGTDRPISTAATSMGDASFTFVVPVEKNGHEWCWDHRVTYTMRIAPRRLRVEAPGCEPVNAVCGETCEPAVIRLECS